MHERANFREPITEKNRYAGLFYSRVRSVELVVSNLEEAAQFYETVWGLPPATASNESRYFRGTCGYHHILGLQAGTQPAMARIVFDVADRPALSSARTVLGDGCEAREAGETEFGRGGYGFAYKDPEGRNFDFFSDSPIIPTPPYRGPAAENRARQSQHGRLRRLVGIFHESARLCAVDDNAPLWFCIATIPITARSCFAR